MNEDPASEPAPQRSGEGSRFDGLLVPAGTVVALLLGVLAFQEIIARRVHFYLENPRYSHCVLVPAVSAIWLYDRWDSVSAVPRRPSAAGFAVAATGVALLLYGLVQNFNMIQHAALLVTLCGTAAALWGFPVVRASSFALVYLLFTVPLPKTWDDAITLPLQNMATAASETVFDAAGWVVVRQGNVLQLPGLKLLVEDACSGVHSLYALVALGFAWTGFMPRPWWLRVTLVVATVPISVAANAIRVIVTGWLAYKVDPSYAQGVSHETTGMIVFGIGLLLFLVVDWCLKPDPVPAPRAAPAGPAAPPPPGGPADAAETPRAGE
jgi:exosortase